MNLPFLWKKVVIFFLLKGLITYDIIRMVEYFLKAEAF